VSNQAALNLPDKLVVVGCRAPTCNVKLGTLRAWAQPRHPGDPWGIFTVARPAITGWPLQEFEVPADFSGHVGIHVCRRHYYRRDEEGVLVVGSEVRDIERHLRRETKRAHGHTPPGESYTVRIQHQRWLDLECEAFRPHVAKSYETRRTQFMDI